MNESPIKKVTEETKLVLDFFKKVSGNEFGLDEYNDVFGLLCHLITFCEEKGIDFDLWVERARLSVQEEKEEGDLF